MYTISKIVIVVKIFGKICNPSDIFMESLLAERFFPQYFRTTLSRSQSPLENGTVQFWNIVEKKFSARSDSIKISLGLQIFPLPGVGFHSPPASYASGCTGQQRWQLILKYTITISEIYQHWDIYHPQVKPVQSEYSLTIWNSIQHIFFRCCFFRVGYTWARLLFLFKTILQNKQVYA